MTDLEPIDIIRLSNVAIGKEQQQAQGSGEPLTLAQRRASAPMGIVIGKDGKPVFNSASPTASPTVTPSISERRFSLFQQDEHPRRRSVSQKKEVRRRPESRSGRRTSTESQIYTIVRPAKVTVRNASQQTSIFASQSTENESSE